MPRGRPKLSGSTPRRGIEEKPIKEEQWTDIEAAAAAHFSAEERDAVQQAASHYLLFADAEEASVEVARAEAALKKMLAVAQELQRSLAFTSADQREADALAELRSLFLDVEWHHRGGDAPPEADAVIELRRSVLSFIERSTAVQVRLKDHARVGGAYQPRGAFRAFVNALAGICAQRGIPVTASKQNEALRTKKSRFVRLCEAVFVALPRHNSSPSVKSEATFADAVAKSLDRRSLGRVTPLRAIE